jgi:hypothetical protein
MGAAVGGGAGTGDGSGDAVVVGGDAAGIGFAEPGVCSEANAAAPHRKTPTRIPESWRSRRRFKRITQA